MKGMSHACLLDVTYHLGTTSPPLLALDIELPRQSAIAKQLVFETLTSSLYACHVPPSATIHPSILCPFFPVAFPSIYK